MKVDACPQRLEGYDYEGDETVCDDFCDDCRGMLCHDCGRHLRYNLAAEDYEHADPAAPECFLVRA